MAAIELRGLTKRFGGITAVDDLTFEVKEGTVTGLLGPNGAGKTTALRMLLGLVKPTAGTATLSGRRYVDLGVPARHVGAALEASSFHPGRRAIDHLRVLASAADLPAAHADAVLARVGLTDHGSRRVGRFSLGMRQRLGLAAALLGEPAVLILDEPTNGLDPQGVQWLRAFLKGEAEQGRTVLVASHLLAEVAQTVDHVVILRAGRLITAGALADLMAPRTGAVVVRTPEADRLRAALAESGVDAGTAVPGEVRAAGTEPEVIGRIIGDLGLVVYEMYLEQPSLEDLFLSLTDPGGSP